MQVDGSLLRGLRGAIWLRRKSCRLAVGGLPIQSHPGRAEVSLSKTPNPPIAPDELVGTLHGSQSPLVCECVCEWVNERPKLYSALDKGAI